MEPCEKCGSPNVVLGKTDMDFTARRPGRVLFPTATRPLHARVCECGHVEIRMESAREFIEKVNRKDGW